MSAATFAVTSSNSLPTFHLRKSASCTVTLVSSPGGYCALSLSARFRSFSTAVIWAPALTSSTVRFPVPGPISKILSSDATAAASRASRMTEWSMRKCCPSHRLAS